MNTSELYQKAVAKLAAKSTLSAADTSYLQAIEAKHGAPAGDVNEKYLAAIQRMNAQRPWMAGEDPAELGRQTKDLIRSGGGVLYL